MGFLTTITIRNDDCHQILDNKREFAELVYDACSDFKSKSRGLGYSSNAVICQKTRHADDTTIYVHAGNTVTEMNPFSEDTKHALEANPDFFKSVIKMMAERLKELKKMHKEYIENK